MPTDVKNTKKTKPRSPSFIKLPTYGFIDMDKLAAKCGSSSPDNLSVEELHKAMTIVMDTVFNTYGASYKKKAYADGAEVVYEMKRYECYLAVYIQHANVTYTVRTNTINYCYETNCCYFAVNHMYYYDDSLLYRMMIDFSQLIYECANLPYAFEHGRFNIPRRCFFDNGSPFYGEKEEIILTPKHYYAGEIDYENDRNVEYPFDEWLDEIRNNHGRLPKD